jgi:general stress protein 26
VSGRNPVGIRPFAPEPKGDGRMTSKAEIEAKLWKTLGADRTVMLGLVGGEDGDAQPMTAQLGRDDGRGPVWFFTGADNDLVRATGDGARAMAHFASKGHDLFASIEGFLAPDRDRATIDRLWNPFVAAWFEKGKDDPRLRLLRLDPDRAQIWLNENSLFAGVRMLLGSDPKQDYRDKVAEIDIA